MEMFDKLHTEINAYNDAYGEQGGKATVQSFQGACNSESDNSDNQ